MQHGGSVIGVVLSAVLDVWLDLGGRDQPHLMAQCRDPSGPIVGGSARFHADDTGGQHFEKCFHAGTAKLSAQHRSPGLVDRMDLKNVWLLSASGVMEARGGGSGMMTVPGGRRWPANTRGSCHHGHSGPGQPRILAR